MCNDPPLGRKKNDSIKHSVFFNPSYRLVYNHYFCFVGPQAPHQWHAPRYVSTSFERSPCISLSLVQREKPIETKRKGITASVGKVLSVAHCCREKDAFPEKSSSDSLGSSFKSSRASLRIWNSRSRRWIGFTLRPEALEFRPGNICATRGLTPGRVGSSMCSLLWFIFWCRRGRILLRNKTARRLLSRVDGKQNGNNGYSRPKKERKSIWDVRWGFLVNATSEQLPVTGSRVLKFPLSKFALQGHGTGNMEKGDTWHSTFNTLLGFLNVECWGVGIEDCSASFFDM